jgi:alkylhydroperoxidase family enzyme
MTRLPEPPSREQFTEPDEVAAYDEFVALRARQYDADPSTFKVQGYYGALANAPRYARSQLSAAFALRSVGNREGSYSHVDREWVDQVLSQTLGCYKVLAQHTRDAVGVGVRLDAIEALWDGRDEDLTDRERLLTNYIRQVATGNVDDSTWSAVLDELGLRGLVEYTTFIGHLMVVLRMHQAFDVPSALNSRDDVLLLITDIRKGLVEVPDAVKAVRVGSG